jgi:SAM-dependent methyltransferase
VVTNELKILSAGCGIGTDVDILREKGYQAWGNDCGSRCLVWGKSCNKKYLIKCSSELLPFPNEYFDIVQCHQVLEHIGVVGDSMALKEDFREIRKNFLQQLLRVVKKGGYLHISTPNRKFPIDPGHCPNFYGVRLHGPFDYFLNSYSDIRAYFPHNEIVALSPKNYYTGTFVGKNMVINKSFNALLRVLDKYKFTRETCINPLTNALIKK